MHLTDREKQVLTWVCEDLTYTQIAHKIFVSPRTAETYFMSLYEKLGVNTRVGLILYALKNGYANIKLESIMGKQEEVKSSVKTETINGKIYVELNCMKPYMDRYDVWECVRLFVPLYELRGAILGIGDFKELTK